MMSGKLGWIEGNKDKAWFNALNRAALNLIGQYAVMAVDLTDIDIYSVPLRDILRTIQTFSFDNLLPTLRNRLAIRQSVGDLFNVNLLVDIDTHANPSKPFILPFTSPDSSRDTTPTPTTRACNEFVSTVENNEANYSAAALAEEKQLTADFVWETTELICHGEFAPRQFWLDTLRAPPFLAKTVDAIGRRYGRLHLQAKTKLHIDQLKCEQSRLDIVVQQGCWRIKDLELDIKYIEMLEAVREDQVRIVKRLQDQQRAQQRELAAHQAAFKAPIIVGDESEDEPNIGKGNNHMP